MAIILCLIGYNLTTPINCQVRVLYIYFISTLADDPKLENLSNS